MPASQLVSWREGVSTESVGEGELCVQGLGTRVVLRQLAPATMAALHRLASPGDDEDRLADAVLGAVGARGLADWYYCLQRLARRGLIARAVQADGRRLATLVPIDSAFGFAPATSASDGTYLLSRFAYLRREGAELVLESPLAHARIVLHDHRPAALIAALATPGTARVLSERGGGLPADVVTRMLSLLAGAGMLQGSDRDQADGEDETPALRSWEFHDLLFHTRSRRGRSDTPFGATYRLAGRLEPPPAVKPAMTGEVHELDRPDLERIERDDLPLAHVLEQRRSVREYGDRPITARQLGVFLYRVARVKDVREVEVATPAGPVRLAFAPRPYPAGGGLYELEFYAVINACEGLAPGLYHYEPQHHRLARLRGRTREVEHLLHDAEASASLPRGRVQVLLVLSARFQRLAWKYASIAYALTLKHVGVVYQTMYLVATAMDLAPCALGGGNSDLFAQAAGTDYFAETSVGEFLLGSRQQTGPNPTIVLLSRTLK